MKTRRSPIEVVLMVRSRKEEAEERALTVILAREREAALGLQRVESDRAAALEQHRACTNRVLTGAEYRELDGILCGLKERVRSAADEATLARGALHAQVQLYHSARCDRELVSELLDARREACRTAEERLEQRRSEDLFLGRFARMRNSVASAGPSAEEIGADG